MVRVSGTNGSETSDGRWARPLEPRLAVPVDLSSSTQEARQCRVIRLRRKWQQISVLRARLIPALTNLAVSTHHVEPLSPSGVAQPSTSTVAVLDLSHAGSPVFYVLDTSTFGEGVGPMTYVRRPRGLSPLTSPRPCGAHSTVYGFRASGLQTHCRLIPP